MKRSVLNRLIAQTGYIMMLTNLTVTPSWFWRSLMGPLDPWVASMADALRQSTLTWMTLCFSEGIAIKAAMTWKWSQFSAVEEEFCGNFLWAFNGLFSIISHLARFYLGDFQRGIRVQVMTGVIIEESIPSKYWPIFLGLNMLVSGWSWISILIKKRRENKKHKNSDRKQ